MASKSKNLQAFVTDLNNLRSMFRKIKSYFPYMDQSLIGQTQYSTAPYYHYANPTKFRRNSPLTNHDISENNDITNWINQNFLIRLHALVESYQLTRSIDDNLPGATELKLLGKLRNCFAHGSGRYDSTKKKHNQVMQELLNFCGSLSKQPGYFPIPINKVCIPIADACEQYARSKLK